MKHILSFLFVVSAAAANAQFASESKVHFYYVPHPLFGLEGFTCAVTWYDNFKYTEDSLVFISAYSEEEYRLKFHNQENVEGVGLVRYSRADGVNYVVHGRPGMLIIYNYKAGAFIIYSDEFMCTKVDFSLLMRVAGPYFDAYLEGKQ